MAAHSSDSTSHADHLLRTTDMEAVLLDLRNKVKDLTAPESPELTAVNEAIDRLYKIVLYGAAADGTGGWGSDPRAEMIYDDPDRQRSMFSTIFGTDGYGLAWTQFLTQTTSSSVMRLTYGNETDIAAWLDTNGKSLSTVVADSTDLLDALDGKSLDEKAIGTPDMINAIGTKSPLELVFGNATRAATWSTSLRSLAEGVHGDARPNITRPDHPADRFPGSPRYGSRRLTMSIALCSASNHHVNSPARLIFSNCAHLTWRGHPLPGLFLGAVHDGSFHQPQRQLAASSRRTRPDRPTGLSYEQSQQGITPRLANMPWTKPGQQAKLLLAFRSTVSYDARFDYDGVMTSAFNNRANDASLASSLRYHKEIFQTNAGRLLRDPI